MKLRLPLLLLILATLALGCGAGAPDRRVTNLRPFVRLTGSIVALDTVSYTAEFFWSGWDDDGVIDHYQYAIDIPKSFTQEQIDSQDDTGIVWRDTTAFRASFPFPVQRPDSVVSPGGIKTPRGRWIGTHTLHLRSVDNEGAVSMAAAQEFNATTVIPRTTITLPRVATGGSGILLVGKQVSIGWDGTDPDSPDPKRRPAYYEWKLITVPSLLSISSADYVINEYPGPNFPWVRVGGDTTSVRLILDPPKLYVFAVRAVDEARAREDRFEFPRNALKMQSSNGPFVGRPTLRVRERTLGTNTFPTDGDAVDYEVAANQSLRFEFSSDAQSYGGIVQGYNWGIDVPDVDAEGPQSGFHGWSLIPFTTERIQFPRSGGHRITIKCRDTAGGVTVANYRLQIIDLPLDRDVLYVDDWFLTRDLFTSDDTLDARAISMLKAAGYDDVRRYDAWGAGDLEGAVSPPPLSELGKYALVYWFVRGSGGGTQNAYSALNQSAVCSRRLQAYLSSGGSLWINGQFVFGALKRNEASGLCIANLAYDQNSGLSFASGEFACDFLHICGGDIRVSKATSRNQGLVAGVPNPALSQERLPTVAIDSTQFAAAALGGLPYFEAMFQPTFVAEGGLDTLYTAQTGSVGSAFNRKPIAWRYAEPRPIAGSQGPVAVFGFPLAYMKQGSAERRTGAHGLARAMADWFRAHEPPRDR